MRFSPITEEEAKEKANGFLLKPGPCDFAVRQAQEGNSKAGNSMIKLTLDVWDADGKKAVVFDYLLEAIPHKIRHFAYSCGLGDAYENGELSADHCEGQEGRLTIRTKPARNGYDAMNDVHDYVVTEESKQSGGYQRAKSRDNGEKPESNRVKAWKAFTKRTAALSDEARNSAWREAIEQVLGHCDQSQIDEEQWHRVYVGAARYEPSTGIPIPLRKKEAAASPIGDEPVFDDADIPF